MPPYPQHMIHAAAPDGAPPAAVHKNFCLKKKGILVSWKFRYRFFSIGVKGTLPRGGFPLREREGVTLMYRGYGAKSPNLYHSTFAHAYANRWNAVICPKIPKRTKSQPNHERPYQLIGKRISMMPTTRMSTSRSALPSRPP